jgi:hypothetical protein
MDNCNQDCATIFYDTATESDQLKRVLRRVTCENRRFRLLKMIAAKGAQHEARRHPPQ